MKKRRLRGLDLTNNQALKENLNDLKCFKNNTTSLRWFEPNDDPYLNDLGSKETKLKLQSKFRKIRSSMPVRNFKLEDTKSEASDPDIKRLKRKAGVCCKFMIECLLIIGILTASTINFNFLSLMYFLGALLLFSERMSLSILENNPRQDTLIKMFMLCIPTSFLFKAISLIIIYLNLPKLFNSDNKQDILFERFEYGVKFIGVVLISDTTFINILLTLTPEIFIGIFIIALNYVSSGKIKQEYMNKQDVLQEKSLTFGSSTLAVLLIVSIEFLAVINVSWIGFIFQLFVLITVLSFSCKKSNILYVIDLISLISIFLIVAELILLFIYHIPLIPLHQLQFIFYFIGVDQDQSQVLSIIHGAGAIAVFVFGIVYLRSRRLFVIQSMYEHQYECSDGEDGAPNLDIETVRKTSSNRNKELLSLINKSENESSNEDEDDEEPEENDYLIWRIYDKIFAAFTSEFVVSNLCRLGLCFWILRYNCLQSVVIVIFLFHSTLIKSYINFLPFIQLIYLPYMILNLVCFYVINLVFKIPAGESHSLSGVKYGIIVFENPYIEFPIMLFCILLSSLFAIKISNFSVMLQGHDESSFQKKRTKYKLKSIQNQSAILSMLYYIFYLSIEALLLFILLLNVISKVNLTNFCLNLYLVVYLIYPDIARKHIQKFLFIIEALNLVNYVYGIVIASSEMTFSVGEIGNLIGIDFYDIYNRKYFNVIPTLRIVALIVATMAIWNTLPGDADEKYQSENNVLEAKIYKTLYEFSECFTNFLYICINIVRNLVIWICYILIFVILIQNDRSIKNWILAILIIFTIYKHCNKSEYYIKYLATYSGFVFISTWVYQFFKFDIVKKIFGIANVEHIPFNGEFWGYTVLTEEQLLFKIVALSALLVISVIGSRSVESKEIIPPDFANLFLHQEIKLIDEKLLYNYLLRQNELIFWSSTSIFWPAITFCATFFHIILTFVLVLFCLYWKLSWVMVAYLFFAVGPWFSLDLNYLQTPNFEKDKPLTYYASKAVREQRLKKWKALMWITAIAWIIIFPSEKALKLLDISNQTKIIFYGEWIGVLDPGTTPYVNFWQHVSGYMGILFLLVIERKFLKWLHNKEEGQFRATYGNKNNLINFEILSKEIERRKKVDFKKNKRDGRLRDYENIEVGEDDEVDHKEKLKRRIDQAYLILKKHKQSEERKTEETKSKPFKSVLKSIMKNTNKNFEEEVKLNSINTEDVDINNLNKSNIGIEIENTEEYKKLSSDSNIKRVETK